MTGRARWGMHDPEIQHSIRCGAAVAPGANVAGSIYQPHITSYDYDCPISEAGGVGQPGIGGDDKFKVPLPRSSKNPLRSSDHPDATAAACNVARILHADPHAVGLHPCKC